MQFLVTGGAGFIGSALVDRSSPLLAVRSMAIPRNSRRPRPLLCNLCRPTQ